jgi:excisionase family DNA binding protein
MSAVDTRSSDRTDVFAEQDDVTIEEAAVELGMSPTAVIRLLETGQLPSHLGADGRRRRVLRKDLTTHRTDRFDLRQRMAQERRTRGTVEQYDEPVDPDTTQV